ncbi:MAG: metallophosphoesterase family protein [Verrucomicrobiales bacterium]|nr:metallophosphoesterase family protein [Verrucomicrobiales bacterium]
MAGLLRILSDLHLGHAGCAIDRVASLAPLLEGARTVVLNGDTCEQKHRKFAEAGEAGWAALRSMAEERGIELRALRGNHDPRISSTEYLDLAEGRLFVTHGDAVLPYLSPWSPGIVDVKPAMDAFRLEYDEESWADLDQRMDYTQRCRSLTPRYRGEFKQGWLKTIRTMARLAWPPRRPSMILHTWLTAHRRAEEFAAIYRPHSQVMVFGHTHRTGLWRRAIPGGGERLLINTGGYLNPCRALLVEVEDPDSAAPWLRVRRVVRQGGDFQPGPTLLEHRLTPAPGT